MNLICMVLTYGRETWQISNKTEGTANFIKRKNLRQIFGREREWDVEDQI
jgi:hypothetical protein